MLGIAGVVPTRNESSRGRLFLETVSLTWSVPSYNPYPDGEQPQHNVIPLCFMIHSLVEFQLKVLHYVMQPNMGQSRRLRQTFGANCAKHARPLGIRCFDFEAPHTTQKRTHSCRVWNVSEHAACLVAEVAEGEAQVLHMGEAAFAVVFRLEQAVV